VSSQGLLHAPATQDQAFGLKAVAAVSRPLGPSGFQPLSVLGKRNKNRD